ncbi:hypothetical protein GOODEAATRI_001031 [Goodea atripinnis]|uniref:AMP-binding enzyme C-terminal domain-containing protein n=1 Tax=Goodea atripinnis TaxID=208336 RepID=A0ABV0ME06_9TELE
MNRMHVISIPYSLMKVNPLSWIQKVHMYKARVAVVKSRDMHWSLLAQRDQRDISLSSLRMLIVADGANPCECICSDLSQSYETLMPPEMGVPPPGKAVLSMSGLSHSVIRVDTEEKLSVLTVQDVGQVMPEVLVACLQTLSRSLSLEDSFQWMSRVLQVQTSSAIDSIHQVGVYCLALVPANTLPKAPLGGIHISETKQRFLEGALHPCNGTVASTASCVQLQKRAERVAAALMGRLNTGDHVALVYPPGKIALCRSIKLQCELYPSRQIAICLDPYCGLGLALWCLCSVYSGHQSILVPPLELESNASLWLTAVSQYKVRVTFCSYSVMEMCTKGLGSQTEALRRHDALYVVGSLDETLELRGMRYHPIDIETSVIRSHKSIAECAVFTWTNLLVVVVELEGSEQEALDLVALVTNVVLEEHYLIVGVVVVVDPGVIPINSRGEKQRMHLRDGFLADQLDPIYVAYNM